MTKRILAILALATIASPTIESAAPKDQGAANPCLLKLVHSPEFPKKIRAVRGEKAIKSAPVIDFEILESGETANARVRRTSGVLDLDEKALEWVKSLKYRQRPKCGTIKSIAYCCCGYQMS